MQFANGLRSCSLLLPSDENEEESSLQDLLTLENSILGIKSGLDTLASEIENKANQMTTDTLEPIEIYMQ